MLFAILPRSVPFCLVGLLCFALLADLIFVVVCVCVCVCLRLHGIVNTDVDNVVHFSSQFAVCLCRKILCIIVMADTYADCYFFLSKEPFSVDPQVLRCISVNI